ncbi:MAG: hypothetical protein V1655_03675 [bacterium]
MYESQDFKSFDNYNLGIMSECPLCKAKSIELNIIEERNNSYLIHSKCRGCENAVLLVAVNNEFGMNVIGMNTDLSKEEFVKFRNDEKCVEFDDVIEVSKSLKNKNFIKELVNI